ncbi:MAG: glycosyltransferase family 4 protein [Proteobacteria bacterium]|nr:glycosyltransferase family 4 protein [Pseudomonadota bacterium]
MAECRFCGEEHNVGFVSTRIAGTDGVSLEITKWADVFKEEGFNCFYFAGELDRPNEVSYLCEEAHFRQCDIRNIYLKTFGVRTRDKETTKEIHKLTQKLKVELYKFIEKYKIDVLVPQNALTIPLNLPLGIALTELIAESGMPTIAHHHDFFWERQEFLVNGVWEFLNMAFPPHLPFIEHVVINSSGDNQLSLRTGISSTIIPNVMDFDNPPPAPDDYASDVKQALGMEDDELLILQPTRVVKRKGIEHAIELVHRLGLKAKLVISHASGDEGYDYEMRVKDYSELMGVNTLFVSDIIDEKRGQTKDGKKIYTLYDIYPFADLVTYPSNIEGFGNAFLEAIYFKKPILVNNYSIYRTDIKPKGFKTIEIDGFVTERAVEETHKVLKNKKYREEMIELNYRLAKKYYSYTVLQQKLSGLILDSLQCNSQ